MIKKDRRTPVLFDLIPMGCSEPLRDPLTKQYCGFFVTCIHRNIHRELAIVTLDGQVCATIQEYSDHFYVAILSSSMEWGIATAFHDVGVGSVVKEHFNDFKMSAC